MSDADSFIQEVSEEVRRDRLFRLWRRYAPFVIGAVVAAVALTAFLEWRKHAAEQAARAAGATLIAAAEAADPMRRAEDMLLSIDALSGGAAALATLRAAGALAEAGEASEAAALYETVAADRAARGPIADFAAFRAAALRAADADPGAAIEALAPLAGPDAPFRLLALEAIAAARLAAGDPAGARADLETVLADPGATEGMRLRAAELIAAIGAPEAEG